MQFCGRAGGEAEGDTKIHNYDMKCRCGNESTYNVNRERASTNLSGWDIEEELSRVGDGRAVP